jgi:hypothetical protein
MRRAIHVIAFLLACAAAAAAQRPAGTRYIIYLHGRILEQQPNDPVDETFGRYEYQQIIDALAARGSKVIAEKRPAGTDFQKFGAHVADQVHGLLAKGVAPENIGVVGFSKGGAIAIVASALLKNPRINYVLLAPCGEWLKEMKARDVDVEGRILSIHEASDTLGISCKPLFERAKPRGEHAEIEIRTGLGHGAFFRPRNEWLQPVVQWLERR